jgi:hypothetical protein
MIRERKGYMRGSPLRCIVACVLSIGVGSSASYGLSTGEEAPSAVLEESGGEHMPGMVEAMTPHQPPGPHMKHMKWTAMRQSALGDRERADEIVRTLRDALGRYKDYHAALDDGFVPMHPERKPRHYHFANKERRLLARTHFDAAQPTSLLYKHTGEGYELEGAMYTAPRGMTEDELNARIPLSVARWHAHVNICLAPDGSGRRLMRRQFGFKGTIADESECRQAGGRFVPQAGGWMIHVYPFEATVEKIWTH